MIWGKFFWLVICNFLFNVCWIVMYLEGCVLLEVIVVIKVFSLFFFFLSFLMRDLIVCFVNDFDLFFCWWYIRLWMIFRYVFELFGVIVIFDSFFVMELGVINKDVFICLWIVFVEFILFWILDNNDKLYMNVVIRKEF